MAINTNVPDVLPARRNSVQSLAAKYASQTVDGVSRSPLQAMYIFVKKWNEIMMESAGTSRIHGLRFTLVEIRNAGE